MKSRLSLTKAIRSSSSSVSRINSWVYVKKSGVIQSGYRADLLPHDRVTVPGFTGSW